jgi:hypothetical protein
MDHDTRHRRLVRIGCLILAGIFTVSIFAGVLWQLALSV